MHNHHVSSETYATYPVARGVSDAVVGARVEGMLAVGAKRSKIYDYLLEHDQNVIKADVDNMVQDFAASVSTLDDDSATAAEVGALAAADPMNCTSISETESGETGVISFSTAFMRKMFSRFGEVLLVDCTHKTNRYNYQLLTFMVMNEFGEGVVVQHSLLESNGDWHMDRATEHFKRAHPDGLQMLRVVIVDKDMNEVRVLQSHFPEARILICLFHVIKYLKEKRSKPEYGKLSADDASQIDAAIHKMVYSATQDEYDTTRESLRRLCARMGYSGFDEYFTRNWDSCQEMWVMHMRSALPHFKNHTNNRLENFFGKLKNVINSSMSMAQCVQALVASDRRAENDYEYRLSRIGRFVNNNYDEEMANVLRFTTHYVAQQIEPEYALGSAHADSYQFETCREAADVVVVHGVVRSHRLDVKSWRCDCEFAVTMRLPCRHAIAYRRHTRSAGPVIPWNSIDERWTSPVASLQPVRQLQYQRFDMDLTGVSARRKKTRTHAERYKEAVRATHLIASELADLTNEQEFNDMLNFVLKQWRNVRQNQMLTGSDLTSAKETNDDVASEQETKEDNDATERLKGDVDIEEEDKHSNESRTAATDPAVNPKVRINPKARKVGRPQKQRKVSAASERADRKWYKAAEEGRVSAGVETLDALLKALDTDKPGLRQTQKRLAGVLIKYAQSSEKKPVFRKMKNPILILDPFYILPPKLMDNCMKILPMKNTNQNPVDVDEDDGTASRSGAVTEVVQIKDVGSFSRKQLELMRRVEIMKNTVQQGFDAHTWILETALPALPAEYHELVSHVGDEIMHTCPDAHIEGLENDPANKYSMLYRVVPPMWLSDAAIRAVCDRLVADYTACRFAGLLDAATKSTRAKTSGEQMVSRKILDRIVAQTMESGVETVLLPLNFHNAHWCCVVVKVLTNRIFYYDPLNQKAYMRAAKDVAVHLKHGGLLNYDVVPQNNPIQFDQFSCGVFVCWIFLRQVVTDLTPDMSDNSLVQRRFELFYYILTGRLIAPTKNRAETAYTPVQPPLDEDKDTVPTSQNSDHEETPPTQVAA